MKAPKQKLHYDERIKQISMQQAKEYLQKRPNAHWMSGNVGDTEFYFIEIIKEKEVKVPIIKTITKTIIKEIPKEIKIEVTKEIEKYVTQIVTRKVVTERKKIIYRQTPEYLYKKREAEIARAELKKAKLEEQIEQLQIENAKLKKGKIAEVKERKLRIEIEHEKMVKKVMSLIKKKKEDMIKIANSPILTGRFFSKDRSVIWYVFIFIRMRKDKKEPEIMFDEYQCNLITGLISTSSLYILKIQKEMIRTCNTFEDMTKVFINYPKIEDTEVIFPV